MTASHDSWTINRSIIINKYSSIEDLGDKNIVIVKVLSLAEELLFVVLVADVRELGRCTRVHCRLHIDDVAYMSFIVLVISIDF